MRLLVFGDFHEGNAQPLARLDDFHQAKIELINEIDQIAKTYQCKAKLQLGDFLDKAVYPHAVLMDIVKRWKPNAPVQQLQRLQNGEITPESFMETLKEDIPLIGIVGNHELTGNSLNTLPKTSIYFLKEMGFMQLVDMDHPVILTDEETGQTVAITGTHYHSKMDQPAYVSDYIVEEKLGDVHIHLVHGYAAVKKKPWLYTPVSSFLSQTMADVTIAGHDHEGFPLTEIDGKQAFNPGSPHATTADQYGFKPKVAILDITPEGVKVEFIPLKTGSNTEEIINRDHIVAKQEKTQKLEEIKSTVTRAGMEKRLSITDIINEVAENQHFPEEIRQDVVQRVEAKMSDLTTESHEVKPYFIEKMELKNFQSHKDTTLEFHSGLNVFVGESGRGKTAIQRAFAFIYEKGKLNPKTFIHTGESECSVKITLSNGTTVTRFVDKTGRKNGYKVYDANTGQTHEGNTKMLPLVQQLLGYFPLVVDESTSMPLNFSKQGEGWYFIGNHITGPTRAKVIGSFYQTHYADAVGKELDQEAKKVTTELKLVTKNVDQLDEQLNEYRYLEALEERLKVVEEKQLLLMEKVQRFEKLKQLLQDSQRLEVQIERHEKAVARLEEVLQEPRQRLSQLTQQVSKFQHLMYLRNQLHTLTYLIQYTEQRLASMGSAEPLFQKLQVLHQQVNYFKQQQQVLTFVVSKINQQQILAQRIQSLESKLATTQDTEALWLRLSALAQQQQVYQQALQLYQQQQLYIQSGKQEAKNVETCEANLTYLVQQYKERLKTLHQCPICLSAISSDAVDHIVASHLGRH